MWGGNKEDGASGIKTKGATIALVEKSKARKKKKTVGRQVSNQLRIIRKIHIKPIKNRMCYQGGRS